MRSHAEIEALPRRALTDAHADGAVCANLRSMQDTGALRCVFQAQPIHPHTAMKTAIFILAAGSALASHTATVQADPGSSLQERRLAILNGTAPGIVIIRSASKAKVPAAAASAASAGGGSGQAAGPAGDATARGADAAPLFLAEPPSGKALNDARRLDSPTLGIALPVARSASQAAGK